MSSSTLPPKPNSPAVMLQEDLNRLRKEAISVKGAKGYFVDVKRLDRIEKDIKTSAENLVEEQAALLTAELESVKVANKQSYEELESKNKDYKQCYEAYLDACEKLKAEKLAAAEFSKNAQEGRRQLQSELETVKAECKTLTGGIGPMANSVSLETFKEKQEELKVLKAKEKELTSKLAQYNRTVQSNSDKIIALEKSLSATKDSMELEHQRFTELQEAYDKANSILRVGDAGNFKLEIDPKAAKLLGFEATQYLKSAFERDANNVRDVAIQLKLAVVSSGNRKIKQLTKLMNEVLDWLKRQEYKARQVLKPWVEMLRDDLARGTIKTLKEYREALEKIVTDFKENLIKVRHARNELKTEPSRKTWWSFVKTRVSTTFSILFSPFRRIKTPVIGGFKRTCGVVIRAVLYPFARAKGYRPVSQDSEDELTASDFDVEKMSEKRKGKLPEGVTMASKSFAEAASGEPTLLRHVPAQPVENSSDDEGYQEVVSKLKLKRRNAIHKRAAKAASGWVNSLFAGAEGW